MSVEARGEQRGEQRGRQEGRQEGKQEGKQEGQASIILTLLSKKFGKIPAKLTTQIAALSLEQIAALTDAFFNFNSLDDLANCLQSLSPNQDNGNIRKKGRGKK